MRYDYCVVGGGLVGLATAYKLLQARPGASLLLLEKEQGAARHQSRHNSGVIHAGIYYAPDSLKARLCRAGLDETKRFCAANGVAFEERGKLIVATDAPEVDRLDALYARATANGLQLERLDGAHLQAVEPNIVGKAALLSPQTAIVDFTAVARALVDKILAEGGQVRFGAPVERLVERSDAVEIGTPDGHFEARQLVVCAGLQADRLARMAGLAPDFRIVPFRGEYYQLPPRKNDIVSHLIYPTPDPSMPFLGIHLTPMIDGSVTVGPNAVLGLAREGYAKFELSPRDVADYATYPGFWRLMAQNLRYAMGELRNSLSKRAYLAACQKYCPSLELEDLQPYRAGIRAQAVNRKGEALHDFVFVQTERMLHVCNAPSPAATSALPIGQMIADKTLAR